MAKKAENKTPAVKVKAFDPVSFSFEDRVYRIHFKNGCSGEYAGVPLGQNFPFDPREVVGVEAA